jgi:sec-independent protein translocase protein TatC
MQNSETFLSHLFELRARVIKILLGLVVIFFSLLPFSNEIYTWLANPLLAHLPSGGHMIATEITTSFFVPIKATMLLALIVSLPFSLYQAWAFVAPGLYRHEKKFVFPLLFVSFILFVLGMLFAYLLVLPLVMSFFANTTPVGVVMMTDISHYFDFVTSMLLAFGFAFEVPVLVVILVRAGIVSIETLIDIRQYVIVAAFVIGAIFTPPDVMSQFLLAVPLCLLYEMGVLFSRLFVTSPERKILDSQ